MSKLLSKLIAPCLILFTIHCSLFTASAQTATATLSGTIQDQNGAVVPGASVTIVNEATSISRNVTTSDEGSFTVTFLPPGTYTLTAKRDGFASVQVREIVLNVADQKSLAIELKVGDASAPTVDVTADAFLVNSGTSVATTIDNAFVQNMPLNGRSFSSLVLLTPGVTIVTSGDGFAQFSVNGNRANANYLTVDGVGGNIGMRPDGNSPNGLAGAYFGQNVSGGTSNLVSQEALQEFKVQTSNYTAESGRQPGGQVQVITRSGGNEFHGSAFDYVRNEAFDARNYFNKKPQAQTPLRQNQFGGTFSGPLPFLRFGDGGGSLFRSGKNRTFFFFSYEGQRLLIPTVDTPTVPSLRLRARAHAALQPILNAFPLPTGPEIETTTPCPVVVPPNPPDPRCNTATNRLYSGFSPYALSVSNPSDQDATSIRIDHSINSKNTLFGRFNEAPSNSTTTQFGATRIDERSMATRTLTMGLTSVLSPKISNEFRVNFSRLRGRFTGLPVTFGGAVPIDVALLNSGLGGFGQMSFSFGTGGSSLINMDDQNDNYQRQFNLVDNVTWNKGPHQFKFGLDYRRLSPTANTLDGQALTFSSENAVVSSTVSNGNIVTRLPANPVFTNLSFFAQDTWKAGRRLTLDVGVRYDLNPAPTEKNGKMPAVIIGISDPTDLSHAALAPAGTPFYKTIYNAFAPRFGVAYQLGTKAGLETVIRGGFGLYYDLGTNQAASGFPIQAQKVVNQSGSGCFAGVTYPLPPACAERPTPIVPTSTPVPANSFLPSNVEDLKLPYTLQWNVAVEQSLGKGQVLSLSYVGSAGRDLLVTRQLNNAIGGVRPNPNFSLISLTYNGPTSDYHSMQAQYRARLGQGLQAIINYTWAHAIDEVSNDNISATLVRGNANFDVRHNFNAALHYEIPKLDVGRFGNALLHGWSVDSIVHVQSAQPVDGLAGGIIIDGIQTNQRPNLILGQPLYIYDPSIPGGRKFNTAAFSTPPAGQQGNFGRNVLRGLPIYQVDMGLARTLTLREKLKLQLKGEMFNVFNHPMFGGFNVSSSSANFGVPLRTLNTALGGMSSLSQLGGPRSIQLSARLSY